MQTVNVELFQKCVGFTLSFRKWGNSKKANLDHIQVNADKKMLKLSKKLIVADEYDAIISHMGYTMRYASNLCVPSFFKRGFMLLGNDAVTKMEDYLQGRRDEMKQLVLKLMEVYPQRIIEAGERLRDEFEPSVYPDIGRLERLFEMAWNFVAFGIPESLPQELFEIERQRQEKMWAEASDQIMHSLRVAFSKLVEVAKSQLTTEPGEKKKKIYDSMLGNIHEFIETFNHRNLVNDSALSELVAKAKVVIEGVSTDDLRSNGDIRELMQKEFAEMSEHITTLIEETPVRSFDFDEDSNEEA